MISAHVSLALIIFSIANVLAAGAKARLGEQIRFTDALSALSKLSGNPTAADQGNFPLSSAQLPSQSVDLAGLGAGVDTAVGSDAAADEVSDSIRSLFNMTEQPSAPKVTEPVPTVVPRKANRAAPPAVAATPAPGKANIAAPLAAVAKKTITRKDSITHAAGKTSRRETKAVVVTTLAPRKQVTSAARVNAGSKRMVTTGSSASTVPITHQKKKKASVAPTQRQVEATVAPTKHQLKTRKAAAVVATTFKPKRQLAAVAKKLPTLQTSEHVASMVSVKAVQHQGVEAHTLSQTLRSRSRSSKDVQSDTRHREDDQYQLESKERDFEARRERELEAEVKALEAKLVTTSLPDVKASKAISAAQATVAVGIASAPAVSATTAQASPVVTTSMMTMTMVPPVKADPDSKQSIAPSGHVSFFSIVGHWFHTLFFGADPAPPPAPILPQPVEPDADRPPFSKQDIDHNAVAAHDDSLADLPIEDDWSRKENEDIESIDHVKREDRALRLDAETPRKPSLPAPTNFRHDSGSTHISNFWGTLADEDADIEAALAEDGDDLSEYERLKKLQDAKVMASVSEINGPIGDHIALERRLRLRKAAAAAT